MHLNLANLLAAMAVVAVLALSLAPFAAETGAAVAVEQGAEQLAQELQTVRQLAVTRNITYFVYFEWAQRSYVVKEANMFAPARRIFLPAGVDWSCPFEQLTFYGSGKVNQGGTIALHHRESALRVYVTIATRTGRIRVGRGQ